jgi:glutathione S-transferase
MKLYHFPLSPNSRKVIAVLHHLNLACDLEIVNLGAGKQLDPAFVRMNPNHMIPVLVDGDFVLWESNAILQYLCTKMADNTLWPLADHKKQADISRWLFWQNAHFGSACGIFVFENLLKNALKLGEPDAAELAKGEQRFHRFAEVLDKHLSGRQWLVGEGLTLADFAIGSWLDLAVPAGYPVQAYAEINRWYKNIEALPAWQSSAPANFPV